MSSFTTLLQSSEKMSNVIVYGDFCFRRERKKKEEKKKEKNVDDRQILGRYIMYSFNTLVVVVVAHLISAKKPISIRNRSMR